MQSPSFLFIQSLYTMRDNPCYICGTTQSEYAFQTSSPVCLQAIKKGPGHSSHPCPITAHTETSHPTGPVPIWHQQPLLPSKPHSFLYTQPCPAQLCLASSSTLTNADQQETCIIAAGLVAHICDGLMLKA